MVEKDCIRVLVVDDHPITRIGIVTILQAQADIQICGQAGCAADAVSRFFEQLPDVTLMDLRLPDAHGVDAIRRIRHQYPSAKIIVLTTYEGDEDIHQALQAGAMGYLIKGMCHDTLVKAIRRVYAGNRFLPPPITHTLSARMGPELSFREREVLSLMVAGKSNKEIGQILGIKEPTVKSHITEILMRLQVTDRTQAVVEALKRGFEHL